MQRFFHGFWPPAVTLGGRFANNYPEAWRGWLWKRPLGVGDNFAEESSHVIPALVRKLIEAKQTGRAAVEVWGSGRASREFLYVEDAAEGIVLATEHYNQDRPVNLGTGAEITIAALVAILKRLVGFKGGIVFDPSRPDGQPRRCLDTRAAQREFGFAATTDLETGLRRTIDWYLESCCAQAVASMQQSLAFTHP